MERQGKKLVKGRIGIPRRLSDGKNAWLYMSEGQRVALLHHIETTKTTPKGWTVELDGQTAAQRNELAFLLVKATDELDALKAKA